MVCKFRKKMKEKGKRFYALGNAAFLRVLPVIHLTRIF